MFISFSLIPWGWGVGGWSQVLEGIGSHKGALMQVPIFWRSLKLGVTDLPRVSLLFLC